jgi:hypothetical protein
MNQAQRDVSREKSVLEHAERIGSVRKACQYFGVSRSSFYLWKKAYGAHGEQGLVNRKSCPVNPKLRTAPGYRNDPSVTPPHPIQRNQAAQPRGQQQPARGLGHEH